ncbi:hypothetical protein ONS95_000475 [Cadophora gregata]|uniref:uncharacterized protein n=1 Tax=Cadophora gregata TaxID=51156 RepID=UPI0026DB6E4B|nr:uncharacterized protein ONS95_000475 [Cadophora gregata]KAK0125517.1 hypothetical protein ONS96_009354 [Cadophora gregata f. sp. sojae]KAK0128503.1 hypothetical protein ONS95_000475 [Cadophora gregata]
MSSPSFAPHRSKAATAPQIRDLAYNLHGWAMEDGIAGDKEVRVITARSPSSITYDTVFGVFNDFNESSSVVFKPDTSFSTAELKPPCDTTQAYLIVGYAKRFMEWKHLSSNPAYLPNEERAATGTVRPNNIIPWDHRSPPVLVVAPMTYGLGVRSTLYALINPRDGLCTPHVIAMGNVFIRSEFRSVKNTIDSSSSTWKSAIRDTIIQLNTDGLAPKVKSNTNTKEEGSVEEAKGKEEATIGNKQKRSPFSLNPPGIFPRFRGFPQLVGLPPNPTADNSSVANSSKTSAIANLQKTSSTGQAQSLASGDQVSGAVLEDGSLTSQLQRLVREIGAFEQRQREFSVKEHNLEVRSVQLQKIKTALEKRQVELENLESDLNTRNSKLEASETALNQRQSRLIEEIQAALDGEKAAIYDTITKGVKRRREGDDELERKVRRLCFSGQKSAQS